MMPTADVPASALAGGSTIKPSLRRGPAALWLLCHYPGTPEANERIDAVRKLYEKTGLPVFVFASTLARYTMPVEKLLKEELIRCGVPAEDIICSADVEGTGDCLDTVQEAHNVVDAAERLGFSTLIGVSNWLQLFQVSLLVRGRDVSVLYVATRLRDRRLWYLIGRLAIIPLVAAGVGRDFLLFRALRTARARIRRWPF